MAVVYEKGLVVLPKAIREKAGFRKGTPVRFEAEAGKITIKADTDDWLEELKQLRKENATASGKEVEEGIKAARAKLYAKWLNVPGR